MGMESGFSYEYHRYGPFSDDLAEQVDDDVIFGHLEAVQRRRQSDGVPYVVYRARAAGEGDRLDAHLAVARIEGALADMQRYSATVLELAATIHWLAVTERLPEWREELVRRKGAKTQNGRDRLALELLNALGLPPAVGVAA
jgi:uncharacterized protein